MNTGATQSALYTGWLQHRRFKPKANAFRYRTFMFYLDLAEIDALSRNSRLWTTHGRGLFQFRRSDYFGPRTQSLDQCIRDAVETDTGARPRGPIRVLTHLRQLGYLFNPVSFYYCFDEAGEHIETMVADITNTPWHERFAYVMPRSLDLGRNNWHIYQMPKRFHVSPFMSMDHGYDWRFTEPDERLLVYFKNWHENQVYFDATLVMDRQPLTRTVIRRTLLRHPLMTFKVSAAIHWQALRLWLRGVPFHRHPRKSGCPVMDERHEVGSP